MSEQSFKIGFTMKDYLDIVPPMPTHKNIINWQYVDKEDWDNCVWRKEVPKEITQDFLIDETQRLKDGQWWYIKDFPIWIPPNYLFFLKYWNAGGKAPEFRLKALKYVYHKIRCRKNPRCIGSVAVKNRQDGITTIEMSDCMFECLDINMQYGQIGIQSKSLDTVIKSCWRTLRMGWQMMPKWFKDHFCDDFVSGDKIAKTFKFIRESDNESEGRDVLIAYGASSHNAFDSLNNMRLCCLDEFAKIEEGQGFYATFLNYKRFIIPGAERKGLFSIFSSPSDTNGKHNDEAKIFWEESEYDEETKTSKSGVFRHYLNPLDGIDAYYDKWGDADPDEIKRHILSERKRVPKEFLQSETRAYPLNEFEMFGSFDNVGVWSNKKGIAERATALTGMRFKNEKTQEPVELWGNLEWLDGNINGGEVIFRLSDLGHFDLKEARFCFHFLPSEQEPLQNPFKPPLYIENCIGVDPFNNRYEAKNVVRQSNGAMVCMPFRDVNETGIYKTPIFTYCCRPSHIDIFMEDCLRAAIFTRSLVQYENRSDKLMNHFQDRGYMDWLLPEIGASPLSMRKGDSPAGKGKFLDEGIGLVDAWLNTPLNEGDPYWLDNIWSKALLDDILDFDPLNTQKSDLTMSLFQCFLGGLKICFKKQRRETGIGRAIMNQLF